jgi:cytochrome P450
MDQNAAEMKTSPVSQDRRLPPTPEGRSLRQLVRDPLHFFLALTSQYGDLVCYRPAPDPAYLINHPDYIRHVLVENNRNYSKETYSNQVFNRVVGEGLLTSEGETWRKQRRMMQPAFHHSRLQLLDEMIVQAAESMLAGWQTAYEANRPIDVAREMAALTLTVTTRALWIWVRRYGRSARSSIAPPASWRSPATRA